MQSSGLPIFSYARYNYNEKRPYKPNIKYLNILKNGVRAWNRWVKRYRKYIIKNARQLKGAYLDRMDLNYADFKGLTFNYTSFYYSKLIKSNFSFTKIAGTSFFNADLRNSNFYKAKITYTNFDYANLMGVKLISKLIAQCSFLKANLENVDFSNTYFTTSHISALNRNFFTGANLKGANLSNKGYIEIGETSFNNCNLENTNFKNSELINVDFKNAYLQGANFYYSNLYGAVIEKKWKPYLLRFRRTVKNWNKIKWVENGKPFNPTLNPYLIRAIKAGDYKKCKKLIKSGADVNAVVNGVPALTWACYKGHVGIVKLLLTEGADINVIDKDGDSILHAAVFKNRVKVIKFLVEHPKWETLKINHKNFKNKTILDIAVEKRHAQILKTLKKHSIENFYLIQNVINKKLISKCMNGDLAIVKFIIKNSADINAKDVYGLTGLMYASSKGYINIVKYLVSKGAKINMRNNRGHTALKLALMNKKYAVARYLRSVGGRK